MDYQYTPMTKYVYVKQHVMDSIKSGQSKVLINPNFIRPPVVHVNPHFKANLTIHINPNVIKPPLQSSAAIVSEKKISQQPTNPIISSKKVLPVPRTTQFTNKYKVLNNINTIQKHPFKIDNRTTNKAIANKNVKRLVSVQPRHVYVKCNKKTSLTGKRKRLINTTINAKKVYRALTINGKRYKIDASNRTLTKLSNKTVESSYKKSYINLKQNLCVQNMGKRLMLSQVKHKSINILKNKLRKSNISCPFYRKFGKCNGKDNGKCIRIHNADQISLCSKFLQGACLNKSCLLSHKVSAEKMPTCRFYLEGLCSKDDCPYLHVKINVKAEICKDFLEGFCKKAAECDKRHQYLCPDFESKGICKKKRCQYPHRSMVRDNKLVKSIPPKLQTQIKNTFKFKPSSLINKEVPEKLLSVRYYDESLPKNVQPNVQPEMDKSDNADIGSNEIHSNDQLGNKRPTVGDLPSFIPFMLNEELR